LANENCSPSANLALCCGLAKGRELDREPRVRDGSDRRRASIDREHPERDPVGREPPSVVERRTDDDEAAVVSLSGIPAHFGMGERFYKGHEFVTVQYLWPDRNGRFAWEDHALDHVRAAQRELGGSPASADAPLPPS
jgi:hypothetical protein